MPHQGQMGIYFHSSGHRLLGTLFLARGDERKPTALLLHGMPGIEKNYDLAFTLREHGWNSLIFHYRGCWGSAGKFTFKSIPDDVRAAIDEMSSGIYPQVDPFKLVLIGHSLGAWAAVLEAAADLRVRAVAALAPLVVPEKFPINIDAATLRYAPWLPGISPQEFLDQWENLDKQYDATRFASEIAPRPLLVVQAGKDELVPSYHPETLYKRAAGPKELLVQPEANHSFIWHRAWLQAVLLEWLKKNIQ